LQCDDYYDEDQLEPSERNKGDVNGERHLDKRRRARELIAANDEREDRHRERSKPSKDENGGTVGSGNEDEDITRLDIWGAGGEDEDADMIDGGRNG
jgi:hypothetical protein